VHISKAQEASLDVVPASAECAARRGGKRVKARVMDEGGANAERALPDSVGTAGRMLEQ
jgi:hypothetical protein